MGTLSLTSLVSSVLVGRNREWQALVDRCVQARQGKGGLLLLAGEAGIGKTALMQQLRSWAEDTHFVTLWGTHIGHRQAPPLHGLRQALSGLFGLGSTDSPAEVEQSVNAALEQRWPALLLHRRTFCQFLSPTEIDEPGVIAEKKPEEETRAQRLFHPLFRLLAAATQVQPLLIFLDDLHWADTETLDCLEYITAWLTESPVLVIASYRPEEPALPGKLLPLSLQKQTSTCPVARLDLEAVTQIAATYKLDQDEEFCRQLHRHSEGVPLFVEQWLLASQAHGVERAFSHRPERVSQTVARRVSVLTGEELQVLRAASVLGDQFEAQTLTQLLGLSLIHTLAVLGCLEEGHGLIRTAPAAELLSFHHTLIRQEIYTAMPRALRLTLHTRAAEVLEIFLESQPERTFEVAHHYLAGQQQERGGEVLFRAGERAFALRAYAQAKVYFQQALETSGAASVAAERRADIEERLGDVCEKLKDREGVCFHWERSLQLHPSPLHRAAVCVKLNAAWSGDIQRQRDYRAIAL